MTNDLMSMSVLVINHAGDAQKGWIKVAIFKFAKDKYGKGKLAGLQLAVSLRT